MVSSIGTTLFLLGAALGVSFKIYRGRQQTNNRDEESPIVRENSIEENGENANLPTSITNANYMIYDTSDDDDSPLVSP